MNARGRSDQLVQILSGNRGRITLVGLAGYGEFVPIKYDDLNPGMGLLPLFLALWGNLFDLGPNQPISIHQACDLEVASLRWLSALGLELCGFHADGRKHRIIGAGQPDLGQLGVYFFAGPW